MRTILGLITVLILETLTEARTGSDCTELTECRGESSPVYEEGKAQTLWLAWSGDADRVALALLQQVLLAQGFCRTKLCAAPGSLCDLVDNPPDGLYDALVIGYESAERVFCTKERVLDVVGTRGPGPPRLHAVVAQDAAANLRCAAVTSPTFITNRAELRACHFADTPIAALPSEWRENEQTNSLLRDMQVQRINVTRAELMTRNDSFFFVDSEIWSDKLRVQIVNYATGDSLEAETYLCSEKVRLLRHAPQLFENLHIFKPRPSVLRELLLQEKSTGHSRSHAASTAAKAWIERNPDRFREIATPYPPRLNQYDIFIFMCIQDKPIWESEILKTHLTKVVNDINKEAKSMLVFINVAKMDEYVDCLDREELGRLVLKKASEAGTQGLIGVVTAGAGVPSAARVATQKGFSLMAYDAQPQLSGDEHASLLTAGPRAADLATALRRALAACDWRRAALLSEDTPAAATVAADLRANLTLKEATLDTGNKTNVLATLRGLKATTARVFVVNAGAEGTARALSAAATLNMTREAGYAWVTREWAWGTPPPLPLLALRAEARGLAPQRAQPIAHALRALGLGYARLLHNSSELRHDHRGNKKTQRLFQQTLAKYSSPRDLTFDLAGVVPPPVVLEAYEAGSAAPATHAVASRAACPAPRLSDGGSHCSLHTGDEFAPAACLDMAAVLGAPALLILALVAGHSVASRRRRARRRRADRELRLRAEACTALLERQSGTVAALADRHVERARVRLLRSLGAGRHGRVWLAALAGERGGREAVRFVAAKEPHAGCSPAEESELLREAATLAGLRHEHVLALVGVCVVGGPPLVLAEQAFFGDLQGYLLARRALSGGSDGEAEETAAPALTRLAREAALALTYLAERALVHCDVRAANCLVDERRSLKLADFGMARALGTGEGAAADEYACRRRKLVPVRWMPPESLARGVFSPASDVWALGVLALELVTLGERPFRALSPPEVVALVKAGGHASLPSGCSRATRSLALACWRREPAARPSARAVAAWLAEDPQALQPAPPDPDLVQDSDDDSGFGESPPQDITISNFPQ